MGPFQRFDPFQELVLFADPPLQLNGPQTGVEELGRDGGGGGVEVFLISDAPVRDALHERAEQLLEVGYFGQRTATTTAAATVALGERALGELLERGYRLSVETRVEVHNHKVGPHPVTYADQLLVAGPESVPDHLRETITANKPLFLAAACVLEPPASPPWLRLLVDRCAKGVVFAVSGVEYLVTTRVLAANVAALAGLDPIDDAHRIEPVVQAALAMNVVAFSSDVRRW